MRVVGDAEATLALTAKHGPHKRTDVLCGDGGFGQELCFAEAKGGALPVRDIPAGVDDKWDVFEAGLAAHSGFRLVDVRAPERYSGETEPIDPVAGHIPGAVNLPSPGNHAADGRFLPAAIIADRYRDAGVASDAVLYCGSGVTAAQSLLALESAGLTAAIYPGSWSDWITDPDRPIATGPD